MVALGAKGAKEQKSVRKAAVEKTSKLAKKHNWYQDRYQVVRLQRNLLFLLTLLSILGLGLSIALMVHFANSKTFEPFVIEVENETGVVTQVDHSSVKKFQANDAVIRSLLVQYVRAREGYRPYEYSYFFNTVVPLLSSSSINSKFRASINPQNPASPINLSTRNELSVRIKSVSRIPGKDKSWQVRFAVVKRTFSTGAVEETKHYISTISFEFLKLDLSQQARYINPLGFQVQSYERDLETGE